LVRVQVYVSVEIVAGSIFNFVVSGRKYSAMNAIDGLFQLLGGYGYAAQSAEAHGMLAYLELLEKWNARINLTASTEWPSLCGLFEEALWAARFYPMGAIRHLDVGSGGGFPALPLRILRREMRLTLVESRTRKATFLESASAGLGLEGTRVCCVRIEEYSAGPMDQALFDRVSWKALKLSEAGLKRLLGLVHKGSEFWAFHGKELPFADPSAAAGMLIEVRRERIPGPREHFLSIFSAR
jgi:16S rRNA (guanine527-N7)-methyltransferase